MHCTTGIQGRSTVRLCLPDGEPIAIELRNDQWRNLVTDMEYRELDHSEVIEMAYESTLAYRERKDERFIQTFVNLYAMFVNTGASMRHEDRYPVANRNGELWSSASG